MKKKTKVIEKMQRRSLEEMIEQSVHKEIRNKFQDISQVLQDIFPYFSGHTANFKKLAFNLCEGVITMFVPPRAQVVPSIKSIH